MERQGGGRTIDVEIHHQLWSDGEGFAIPQLDAMWGRSTSASFMGRRYRVLALPDIVGFAAIHAFLHLIHGDVPLQRIWEIGRFLSAHANDDLFWAELAQLHSSELVQIEVMVFAIAASWFDCEKPDWVRRQQAHLPNAIRRWLATFCLEPLRAADDYNKNHLWLRLAMVRNRWKKVALIAQMFVPSRIPAHGDGQDGSGYVAALRHHRGSLLRRAARQLRGFPATFAGCMRWFSI